MSGELEASGEHRVDRVRYPMNTRERFDPRRPCGELLADVPWDGVLADAEKMTARQFLGTLLG